MFDDHQTSFDSAVRVAHAIFDAPPGPTELVHVWNTPNSAKTAAYLGIDTPNLPDVRDVLADPHDYSPQMLESLMRGKPGHISRGGGLQKLDGRPDGEYLFARYLWGLLEADKRPGRPGRDPGGYGAWRRGPRVSPVRPYAHAVAEATLAWAGPGGSFNSIEATTKAGRPSRHRPTPLSTAHCCERIPRKPMQPFTMGAVAA